MSSMSNILVALLAYIIDKIFGEFRFIKHPIICIGDLITIFESRFYKDSVIRGLYLVIFVLLTVTLSSLLLTSFFGLFWDILNIVLTSFVASMFLAHKMLYDSVKNILTCESALAGYKNKREAISMLVSRDTEAMSDSDVYKASIETYAENLSDGVIAPLFYLILFGLPGIIIYNPNDGAIKSTDFGIAKVSDDSRTNPGSVMGSPLYMSPEQLEVQKVTGASDIYSLGVTLYKLVSGATPYEGDTLANLTYQILNKRPRSVREFNADIPNGVVRLINKAIQREPDKRFASAATMAEAVRRLAVREAREVS